SRRVRGRIRLKGRCGSAWRNAWRWWKRRSNNRTDRTPPQELQLLRLPQASLAGPLSSGSRKSERSENGRYQLAQPVGSYPHLLYDGSWSSSRVFWSCSDELKRDFG